MPKLIAILLALCAVAHADPPTRVVLADQDPALRSAVQQSLRPWRIEVIVEANTPRDDTQAAMRAGDRNARYVVWREGAELVVFDRDTNHVERRAARAGSLDALGAAAAALSVKTMLRLPDAPSDSDTTTTATTATTTTVAPVIVEPTTELRFDAGLGARGEYGLDSNVALRFLLRGSARPWLDHSVRFGIAGDFGAAATVNQAGFKGEWTNWALLGTASVATGIGDYELAPWFGAGIEHSQMSGTEMGMPRSEEALLPAYRVGATLRRSYVGVDLTIEGLFATRTYTKLQAPAQVFEIPPISAVLSLFLTTDVAL